MITMSVSLKRLLMNVNENVSHEVFQHVLRVTLTSESWEVKMEDLDYLIVNVTKRKVQIIPNVNFSFD